MKFYPEWGTPTRHRSEAEPLADLRALVSLYPDLLYAEPCELARLLDCGEAEAEAARRWIAADGLEARQ